MVNDIKEQNHKTDFSSGFLVGVLAGFAGYFLTKTEEGSMMRKKFDKEWKTARKKLVKEGVIHDDNATIADLFEMAKSKIAEAVGEDFLVEQTAKNEKAKSRTRSKKKKTKRVSKTEKTAKKKKMFKGL